MGPGFIHVIMWFRYSTLTNVNFDHDRFPEYIRQAVEYRDSFRARLIKEYEKMGKPFDKALTEGPAVWKPEKGYDDLEYLESEGEFINSFCVYLHLLRFLGGVHNLMRCLLLDTFQCMNYKLNYKGGEIFPSDPECLIF